MLTLKYLAHAESNLGVTLPFQADEKLIYKTVDDIKLKLHVFKPKDHKASDKRPCIIFFFGGGWIGGHPIQFYPHCKYLASRGLLAISAEYRTQDLHGTSPLECVKDGKSAIRWIRQHAKDLGIDPNRIIAGGGSAGGHVAAATGTTKTFDESDENLSISSVPNALVLYNPVFDNGPKGYGYQRVKKYWKQFSPLHNINSNTPPTIVFLGTRDQLVPVSTAKKFKKLMEKEKNLCDLHLYKDQKHGFFNFRENNKYYYKTLIETDKFLTSLNYLNGDATLKIPTLKFKKN